MTLQVSPRGGAPKRSDWTFSCYLAAQQLQSCDQAERSPQPKHVNLLQVMHVCETDPPGVCALWKSEAVIHVYSRTERNGIYDIKPQQWFIIQWWRSYYENKHILLFWVFYQLWLQLNHFWKRLQSRLICSICPSCQQCKVKLLNLFIKYLHEV